MAKVTWVPIIALLAAALPPAARASVVQGQIRSLLVNAEDGTHVVGLTGTPTFRPPCAKVNVYYVIADENSRAGQSQFAQLLAAQVEGRVVRIVGRDMCKRMPAIEDIRSVEIVPGQ